MIPCPGFRQIRYKLLFSLTELLLQRTKYLKNLPFALESSGELNPQKT